MSDALTNLSLHADGRDQTVLTGQPVVSFLSDFWGATELDPCAAPAGPLWVPCSTCKGEGCKKCKGVGGSIQVDTINPASSVRLTEGGDGLAVDWLDKTFVNPPYNVLAPWLLYERIQGRVVWLVPVRPHRKWWRSWARGLDALAYLNPQKFKGHASSFPGPLCLGLKGSGFGRFEFLVKSQGLGEVL